MHKPLMSFTEAMAAATDTCTVSFPQGYDHVFCGVPTLSTSCELQVFGSADGSTFHQVFNAASGTTTTGSMLIGSALGTNGGITELFGVGAFKYVRLVASAAVSNAANFVFHCS